MKDLRIRAGKSVADVAFSGIVSKSTLSLIEGSPDRPVKIATVMALCSLYQADQETTNQLVKMAQNHEKGWWEDYARDLDPKFRFFIQAEAEATHVFTYDAILLYGLLQTPAYHRAVFEAKPDASGTVDREAEFRLERQKATLTRTPPLQVTAVIDEGVLARQVGGTEVMKEQVEHLRRLDREAHITLMVLPWSAGAHAAMGGSFKVALFDAPDNPDVVYMETSLGVRYTEEADQAAAYHASFDRLRRQAVNFEEYMR